MLLIVFELSSTYPHICNVEIKLRIGQRIKELREKARIEINDDVIQSYREMF